MSRPLRIAYFDLGLSREQYGLQPTRYGGGGVAARYLKQDPDIEFTVIAPLESFDNLGPNDRIDRCCAMPETHAMALRRGVPITDVIGPHLPFDLILHPHTCETLNRGSFRGPIVHFCGFDGAAGHPGNDYILLYDDSFTPRFGEKAKYVRIGKPVPAQCPARPVYNPFSSSERRFVFQCSRHDDHQNTIAVAKACLEQGVPGVFAGPIHNGYPLMDYIEGPGGMTTYVGEIPEDEKLEYCRRAALFTLLPTWDVPFSQSIIEAQGQGCPIYVNRRGPFLTKYLHHSVNGFDAAEMTLCEAFEATLELDMSQACWRAAREYDVSVMTASFKRAFAEIVTEWDSR